MLVKNRKYYINGKELYDETVKCLNKYNELNDAVNQEEEDKKIQEGIASKKFKNELEGKRFYAQLRRNEALSKKLLDYMLLIAERSTRRLYYSNPDDKQDCYASACKDLISYWTGFNPEKGTNAVAYFTTIVYTGSAKGWKEVHPKKYSGTISINSGITNEGQGMYSI